MDQHQFIRTFLTQHSESLEDSLTVVSQEILSTVLEQAENVTDLKTDG